MWLTNLKVVDFTTLLPGPYATLRLADLGCDVVKIEPPGGGDPARYTGPKVDGTGVVFLATNRNKRSVVIDLKTAEGCAEALHLMADADVVIEGFRPGVMHKLGLDYESAKKAKQDVIYCSLTGYGQTGPLAQAAGHDLNYLAVSGLLSQFTDADGVPVQPTVQLADLLGGIAAVEAILAALVRRGQTGEGSYLDVSMTDASTGLLPYHVLMQQAFGMERGLTELSGRLVCYHLYQTGDGQTVSLAALEPKFWQNFCTAAGKSDWLQHQFTEAVPENLVYGELTALFRSRTLAEWTEFGRNTDCCLQPVWSVEQVLVGDVAQARNTFVEAVSSEPGRYRQLHTRAGGQSPDVP